jgi:FtsH-binding integral membrane protein
MAYGRFENAQGLVRGAVGAETRFMASVYRWMTLGLVVTSGVAWFVAASPAAREVIFGNRMVFWGLVIAQFGLVIAISAAVNRLSAGVAGMLFVLYSGLTGATLASVLLVYTGSSVASAFMVTAGTFAGMSIYATVTKRDLSAWGTFLIMGLIGVIIASVVNLFLKSGMLQFVLSAAAVVVFTGLTAYDTQKLRRMAAAGVEGMPAAMPVNGALMLYLDFINLFLALLNLFGGRRN